jgi:hypothetical protein
VSSGVFSCFLCWALDCLVVICMHFMWGFTKKQWIGLGVFVVLVFSALYLSGEWYETSISNRGVELQKLYNKRLFQSACSVSCTNCQPDVPLCSDVDNDRRAGLIKEEEIEISVPAGGGYLGFYFDDLEDHRAYYGNQVRGGFSFDDVSFKPSSSNEQFSLNDGLRVFNSGTIIIKFDRPYFEGQRLKMNYHFLVYFLPHTELEKRFYLNLANDRQDAIDYAKDNRLDVQKLCAKVGSNNTRIPAGCPGGDSDDARVVRTPQKDPLRPGKGGARRPIEFELSDSDYFGFQFEPFTIPIESAFDPDGLCADFDFEWENTTKRLKVQDWEPDQDAWNLFFIPRSIGMYTMRVRAVEHCEDLGNQSSEWVSFRVHSASRNRDFPDINDAAGFQGYIMDLYGLGVMTGYPDKMMRPLNLVNRAEFLKMLFEVIGYDIPRTSFTARYPDVRGNEWFADYVFAADELGVIEGYPDGFFRPAAPVNRVEALKMAMNMVDIVVRDTLYIPFADVSSLDWFSRYVQTAFREGITDEVIFHDGSTWKLKEGGNFFPGELITRAEAAKIIVRTFVSPINRLNQVQLNKVK